MAGKLLHTFTVRDESHKKLEEVLAGGKFPRAECRENHSAGEYTVWDGPADPYVRPPEEPKADPLDDLAEKLADRVLAKINKKMEQK